VTSRQAAVAVYGEHAVAMYETVKRFYTRYGVALERTYADAVGGRLGRKGGGGVKGEPDVITPLGRFEFCAQANTKNAAGVARDTADGVICVQVSERPRNGRISGEDFLRMHNIDNPDSVAVQCQFDAMLQASDDGEQLRL
jgi:hypothetical protein